MALITQAPIAEPVVDASGNIRRAWSLWVGQVFRGSAFLGAGVTADRPALRDLRPGTYFLDTTLGIPIFVNAAGTGWINAAGVAV